MNIFADKEIPNLPELFKPLGNMFLLESEHIDASHLKRADILLTRTVTSINQSLIEQTPIQFIGTASAGFDHVDLDYLKQKNIGFSATPGCNANAVGEYVLATVTTLKNARKLPKKPGKAGIIGLGHTGLASKRWLENLGFEVICYDPPKADLYPAFHQTPLSSFKDLDIICCHPALTKTSHHLIDKSLLEQQKPGTVLINTSRGEVINWADLQKYGTHLTWCFDVWPNEPHIDPLILEKCFIATPHIAGYSQEAKRNSVLQLYQAVCAFLHISPSPNLDDLPNLNVKHWEDILSLINPLTITQALKQNPANFKALRKTQLQRRELAK